VKGSCSQGVVRPTAAYGRTDRIILAALLTLPLIPVWAYGAGPFTLAIGAFLMQFAVQGAWGVVPAHLNELSPAEVRGTFPGFTYQIGNLLASANATCKRALPKPMAETMLSRWRPSPRSSP
jgi:SHS family lactate transporter-like MFS transporter